MVAYAAEAQPTKPTHGGTASMLTLAETIIYPTRQANRLTVEIDPSQQVDNQFEPTVGKPETTQKEVGRKPGGAHPASFQTLISYALQILSSQKHRPWRFYAVMPLAFEQSKLQPAAGF